MIETAKLGSFFRIPALRYLCGPSTEVILPKWARAAANLLNDFAIKPLVIRGERGFRQDFFLCERCVRDLTFCKCCVESVIEVGRVSLRKLVLGEPGDAWPLQPSF